MMQEMFAFGKSKTFYWRRAGVALPYVTRIPFLDAFI